MNFLIHYLSIARWPKCCNNDIATNFLSNNSVRDNFLTFSLKTTMMIRHKSIILNLIQIMCKFNKTLILMTSTTSKVTTISDRVLICKKIQTNKLMNSKLRVWRRNKTTRWSKKIKTKLLLKTIQIRINCLVIHSI